MKRFFDVHFFCNGKEDFSVPVQINSDGCVTENMVIEKAITDEQINSDDTIQVDYVEIIDEELFVKLGGTVEA
jgi:hypothetical protein